MNKRRGFGTFTGAYSYKGEWFDDLKHGEGSITWVNGSTFDKKYSNP